MAQKDGYWVVRTYKAGSVGEKTKFWVPGNRPNGKLRRKDKDAIRKQAQNEHSAVKQLARLMNANFGKGCEKSLVLGLDYNEKGMKKLHKWIEKQGVDLNSLDEAEQLNVLWLAADHELWNCLRRVKRRCGKEIALKAVYVTSDMDGDTGETVRVHHHLVINADVKDAFVDAWKDLGSVDWEKTWDNQEDRTPLAEYFIKQVRHVPDAKKYRSTRNLIRPVPKDHEALSDAELRVPQGGRLLFRREFTKPGQPQYIRYVLPPKSYIPPDGGGLEE